MASINIINRILHIEDEASHVGRFLLSFWHQSFPHSVAQNFSDSDFLITVKPITDPQPYCSYKHKELIESFTMGEGTKVQAYRLMKDGIESSWLLGNSNRGAHLIIEHDKAVIEYWGEDPVLVLIVFFAIGEALGHSGLVSIHAAAASFNGEGYIFLGKSGTGKTTTLLRGIKSGWSPLAEDTILVDPETLTVYGWEDRIRLLPKSLQILDEPLRSYDWGEPFFDKFWVPYDKLCKHYNTERINCFPLSNIVDLARQENTDKTTCKWIKTSSTQLTLALWKSVGLPLSEKTRQLTSKNIGKIAVATSPWKLELGDIQNPLLVPDLSHQ